MSYSTLQPLMKKLGVTLTAKEFHQAVNVTFHNYEAEHYDALHSDMASSLQEQVHLLASDILETCPKLGHKLRLLDVGAGTGLSTKLLLQSRLGAYIQYITLVDTSAAMLTKAKEKAKDWNKETTYIQGDIFALSGTYDIILTCSVLHHIPEIKTFIDCITSLQQPKGLYIHLQDPNGDHLQDETFLKRKAQLSKLRTQQDTKPKGVKHYIPKRLRQYINRMLGRYSYIDKINNELLEKGIVKRRMTADELWSITDIHVANAINANAKGISFRRLKDYLSDYQLINHRTYGFFGLSKSELPSQLVAQEDKFVQTQDKTGRNLAAVWRKVQDN